VAYVTELGYLDGHDHAMVDGDRVIQSIEGMEIAASIATESMKPPGTKGAIHA
jgi:hypothetical protein